MPFKNKELEQLAQQILSNATLKQTPVAPPKFSPVIQKLRQLAQLRKPTLRKPYRS